MTLIRPHSGKDYISWDNFTPCPTRQFAHLRNMLDVGDSTIRDTACIKVVDEFPLLLDRISVGIDCGNFRNGALYNVAPAKIVVKDGAGYLL